MNTERTGETISEGVLNNEEIEIDLLDLCYLMLDKLHHIILCLLAGSVLFNAYAYFMVDPTYESTSKLYVVSSADDSVVDLSDLNIGTSLTSDYEELILSYPVLNKVIDKMNLNLTSEELAKKIAIVNPDDTRILRITVTTTDPVLSKNIANTVAEVATEYLPETMSTVAPNIAQVAKVADRKANPSYTKYTMIGALLGMLLCCGCITVEYLLDDTIRSGEDMEKYFNMVPLTVIPQSDEFSDYDMVAKKDKKKGIGRRLHRK